MLNTPYHYTESGLDNVYIYNMPVIKDVNGEEVIYIQKINLLHKAIAEGLIKKAGLLNGKEIRFLRSEMGYSQKQLSELLGKEAQACGRWEREEVTLDKTVDSLLRIVIAVHFKIKIDLENISCLVSSEQTQDKIKIDGQNCEYKLVA